MSHHHELTMSEETASQPQIKITWLIGTLVAFAIFALIGGYSARMTQTYTDYDQDQATIRYANLAQEQKAESKLINPVDKDGKATAEWVDQDKGFIRIPIEEAMAKEVDTLKVEPLVIACAIPGAVAPAAPAPAPATTNAAPVQTPAPAAKAKPASTEKPKADAPAKPKT